MRALVSGTMYDTATMKTSKAGSHLTRRTKQQVRTGDRSSECAGFVAEQ